MTSCWKARCHHLHVTYLHLIVHAWCSKSRSKRETARGAMIRPDDLYRLEISRSDVLHLFQLSRKQITTAAAKFQRSVQYPSNSILMLQRRLARQKSIMTATKRPETTALPRDCHGIARPWYCRTLEIAVPVHFSFLSSSYHTPTRWKTNHIAPQFNKYANIFCRTGLNVLCYSINQLNCAEIRLFSTRSSSGMIVSHVTHSSLDSVLIVYCMRFCAILELSRPVWPHCKPFRTHWVPTHVIASLPFNFTL